MTFIVIGTFDVIVASNLLCRVPSPRKFLQSAVTLLNPGGSLVLISPYSWLEEYTPVNEWVGATVNADTKEEQESSQQLELFFNQQNSVDGASQMNLVHKEDIPFLIREHERKYQFGVSDCTIWRKT